MYKNFYKCPVTHKDFEFKGTFYNNGKPRSGFYQTKESSSEKYLVEDGLPDFCFPRIEFLPLSARVPLSRIKIML